MSSQEHESDGFAPHDLQQPDLPAPARQDNFLANYRGSFQKYRQSKLILLKQANGTTIVSYK